MAVTLRITVEKLFSDQFRALKNQDSIEDGSNHVRKLSKNTEKSQQKHEMEDVAVHLTTFLIIQPHSPVIKVYERSCQRTVIVLCCRAVYNLRLNPLSKLAVHCDATTNNNCTGTSVLYPAD